MKSGYIVAYDISETKLRNKVFEALKDFGLKHIQESVFWGRLSVADKNAIKRLLGEACGGADDRAIVLPMNTFDLKGALIINYPDDAFSEEEYVVV